MPVYKTEVFKTIPEILKRAKELRDGDPSWSVFSRGWVNEKTQSFNWTGFIASKGGCKIELELEGWREPGFDAKVLDGYQEVQKWSPLRPRVVN